MSTIDLLRHGEPVGGVRYRGDGVDDPLSERGWAQMWAAVGEFTDWTHVISSPLLRCCRFADAVAERYHLPLVVDYNGTPLGRANAGVDMTFDFPTLVAHAAKTRPLGAGAIIGSGTVSNKDSDGSPGKPVAEGGLGYSCIAEIRMIETIQSGKPATAFMQDGDRVRMAMHDARGQSLFGSIEQTVAIRGPD